MIRLLFLPLLLSLHLLSGCSSGTSSPASQPAAAPAAAAPDSAQSHSSSSAAAPTADAESNSVNAAAPAAATAQHVTQNTKHETPAAAVLARRQVPILCYHQIRDWTARDSKSAKDYIIPPATFREHLQLLADSGYQTILPDQLLAYLSTGAPLPPKPILLTFDDNDMDHYTVAKPELERHGFKGVFFIMTVTLGRPGYMTKQQVRELSEAGHIIGCHTWDHHNVKKYEAADWVKQVEKPTRQLEQITGKPVRYFAYPFGLWNEQATQELKQRNFAAAFQLATKRSETEPLFTIRRIIASGYWSARKMYGNMKGSFR